MIEADHVRRLEASDHVEYLRKLDPDLIGALLDPASYTAGGGINLFAVAAAVGRSPESVAGQIREFRAESSR